MLVGGGLREAVQAWSRVNNYRGRDQVRFNWFCENRAKPVAPYDELIKNYDPTDRDAIEEQRTVNEYSQLRRSMS
jgi:hypothetical protein